jgi:hypothetical protein
MKIYADGRSRRVRQQVGDLSLVVWSALWLWVAAAVHDATLALAAPGRRMQAAGGGLAGQLRDAGSVVGNLPLVGDDARAPFDGAGRAADQLSAAGGSTVEAVQHLAFWLTVVVAAVPVTVGLVAYLPRRWRFMRQATAGRRLIDSSADLELFALRAMANQPMHRLARVSSDPVGAWRSGDRAVVRALALLELRDAGLTPPRGVPGDAAG